MPGSYSVCCSYTLMALETVPRLHWAESTMTEVFFYRLIHLAFDKHYGSNYAFFPFPITSVRFLHVTNSLMWTHLFLGKSSQQKELGMSMSVQLAIGC